MPVRTLRIRLNRSRVSAVPARLSMESEATWWSSSGSTPGCGPAGEVPERGVARVLSIVAHAHAPVEIGTPKVSTRVGVVRNVRYLEARETIRPSTGA